jgi:phosphoribosyl 1,2-cyclic phosphodiesterase
MTKKKLNTYTLEFKESAIKLALDSDESIPQIANLFSTHKKHYDKYSGFDTLNAQKNQHYVEQPRRTSHDFLRILMNLSLKSLKIWALIPTLFILGFITLQNPRVILTWLATLAFS